jgi:hypothetical protein
MKPANGGSKRERPEECCGLFIVSGCHASALLQTGSDGNVKQGHVSTATLASQEQMVTVRGRIALPLDRNR